MKKRITLCFIAGVLLLSGCSAKNGALIGGTTAAIAGGLLGAGLSKQHVGNGKTTQSALQVGLALGVVGALLGAGTGYVVEEATHKDDNEIKEMIQSEKQIKEMNR